MRIGVHGRSMASQLAPEVARVLARMQAFGLEPLLGDDLAAWLRGCGQPVNAGALTRTAGRLKDVEMLLSLGGDGTLLDSVAMVGRAGIPVLGINLGRLGFLSSVPLEGTDAALEAIATGRYTLEERALLQVEGAEGLLGDRNFALNEVSLHKRDSSSMISVHATVGDQFLNTYWADGLIVATPTGSTAYSLSCGGPLLDPRCDSLVITPIAPHNLNVRPFVVPDRYPIRLVAEARGGKTLLNLDSRGVTLDAGTELTVARAPFAVQLVHLEGHDFMNTLRTKLMWGLDLRTAPPLLGPAD
jgi:NAD+ kinase